MVQLISLVGAAALFTSAIAAPAAVRRSQHEYQQQYDGESQPEKAYDTPSYQKEDKYVASTSAYYAEESYAYSPEKAYETDVEEYDTTTAYDAEPTKAYQYEQDKYQQDQYKEGEYEETSTYEYAPEYTKEAEYEYKSDAKWTETKKAQEEHPTSTAEYSYPTYGSGSNQWGASYDDCVSQCVAKHGAPNAAYTPSPQATETAKGNIHTVMVAPESGVLRYYPFALNATVGDTVRYVWTTPANHTATLSSELAICNKSALAEDRKFVSGIKSAAEGEQIFDIVVETEEPQFFYCSVAEHCQKGMFGVINPKSEFGGLNTVGAKMNDWVSSNPDLSAAWNYVHNTTKDTSADSWGNSISLDNIPESAYTDVAANVIWTRAMFGANPGSIEKDLGAATPDGSPIQIVGDLNTLLSATNQDPNAAAADVPQGTPTGAVPDPTEAASQLGSGASKNAIGFSAAAVLGVVSWMLF